MSGILFFIFASCEPLRKKKKKKDTVMKEKLLLYTIS